MSRLVYAFRIARREKFKKCFKAIGHSSHVMKMLSVLASLSITVGTEKFKTRLEGLAVVSGIAL